MNFGRDNGDKIIDRVSSDARPKRPKIGMMLMLGFIILSVSVIASGLIARGGKKSDDKKNDSTLFAGIKNDQYQALTLTNGEQYYARVKSTDMSSVVIEDIYYIRKADQKDTDPQVIKYGTEVFKPDNQMRINYDKIMYWSNIDNNGSLVKSIKSAEKTN